MISIAPFLWFNDQAEEALNFYVSVIPNSKMLDSQSAEIGGMRVMGFNGGPHFAFTPAVSFFVRVNDQAEVDHYWEALTANGGEPGRCGWLTDRYGFSWQIIPTVLTEYLGHSDRAAAARATDAMLGMNKIIIADLETAFAGS